MMREPQTLRADRQCSPESASEISGVDSPAHRRMGCRRRAFRGTPGGVHDRRKAASGDGLSLGHGRDRARQEIRKYGAERVEAACARAVRMKVHRYQSVKSILASGLDRQRLLELVPPRNPVEHDNIRGASYYAGTDKAQEVSGC
jgi:hypothetical protein